jgi:hypothetical protein
VRRLVGAADRERPQGHGGELPEARTHATYQRRRSPDYSTVPPG